MVLPDYGERKDEKNGGKKGVKGEFPLVNVTGRSPDAYHGIQYHGQLAPLSGSAPALSKMTLPGSGPGVSDPGRKTVFCSGFLTIWEIFYF